MKHQTYTIGILKNFEQIYESEFMTLYELDKLTSEYKTEEEFLMAYSKLLNKDFSNCSPKIIHYLNKEEKRCEDFGPMVFLKDKDVLDEKITMNLVNHYINFEPFCIQLLDRYQNTRYYSDLVIAVKNEIREDEEKNRVNYSNHLKEFLTHFEVYKSKRDLYFFVKEYQKNNNIPEYIDDPYTLENNLIKRTNEINESAIKSNPEILNDPQLIEALRVARECGELARKKVVEEEHQIKSESETYKEFDAFINRARAEKEALIEAKKNKNNINNEKPQTEEEIKKEHLEYLYNSGNTDEIVRDNTLMELDTFGIPIVDGVTERIKK